MTSQVALEFLFLQNKYDKPQALYDVELCIDDGSDAPRGKNHVACAERTSIHFFQLRYSAKQKPGKLFR